MNVLSEKFEQIKSWCDEIEDAGYACYKLFAPVSAENIGKWEADNFAKLPEGYKNWLLLSNGFEMGSAAELFPLERIVPCPFPEYEGYFVIGNYIGDGSALLCDRSGGFFELDHAYGLEETSFEKFLDEWIIGGLKDNLLEIEKMNENQ